MTKEELKLVAEKALGKLGVPVIKNQGAVRTLCAYSRVLALKDKKEME